MSAEKVHSLVGHFLALWSIKEDVKLQLVSKNGRAHAIMEFDFDEFDQKIPLKSENNL